MAGGEELLLQDRDWRRRNSMWMLPALACCGLLTWTSFLYIGVKAKRPSWLAAAAFYGVVFVLYAVLVGTAPEAADGSPNMSAWPRTAGTICFFVVWLGGIVHALIVNPQWLSFLASPQAPANTSSFSASAPITPGALDDPWRSFVSQALTLQREIATAVVNTPSGPMQDRLKVVTDHVDAGLTECRQLAQGGQRLSDARARIDTAAIARQLSELPPLAANPSLTQAARALQAQLDTATRIETEISASHDGLLLLNARLGEVAARVIELSARPQALNDAAEVDTVVESVVDELVAIREALTEMDGYPADL
ncbi:MAG TPA: hypothetical protein VJM33_16570 [Microthrixaceae bacterium]|nr:hypothetical protein [Microthrixaceae bacterium]